MLLQQFRCLLHTFEFTRLWLKIVKNGIEEMSSLPLVTNLSPRLVVSEQCFEDADKLRCMRSMKKKNFRGDFLKSVQTHAKTK